ncbi:hypothetical protein Hanom_Chr03g00232801 [Helianthus anomalus]
MIKKATIITTRLIFLYKDIGQSCIILPVATPTSKIHPLFFAFLSLSPFVFFLFLPFYLYHLPLALLVFISFIDTIFQIH